MRRPLIVNYGAGVDSTALLIGLRDRGVRPDLVIFADTGSEKPETYDYLPIIGAWLAAVGFPVLTVVRRYGIDGEFGLASKPSKTGPGYTTIEGNCLQNKTLPSLAFGRKACSLKWKADPMDHWLASWQPAIDIWAAGGKPTKALGYDCGPADSRRAVNIKEDKRFIFWAPLRDWGWDRDECERQIAAVGLPIPMKSACFFCPASKPEELVWLEQTHPVLFHRAIALEDRARPYLTTIEGLWRRSTKTKPGSWRTWATQRGFLKQRAA